MKSQVIITATLALFAGTALAQDPGVRPGEQPRPQQGQTDKDKDKDKKPELDKQHQLPGGGLDKQAQRPAQIGTPAPDFAITALDGTTHRLGAYKGKIVVMEWVDPDCPYCLKHHEKNKTMNDLYDDYKDENVVFFAVASGKAAGCEAHKTAQAGQDKTFGDTTKEAGAGEKAGDVPAGMKSEQAAQASPAATARLREVAQRWELKYPVLLDPDCKVAKQFNIQVAPQVVIVDKNGILVYSGAIDDDPSTDEVGDENYVEDALDALTDNKPIEKPSTTPYGTKIDTSAVQKN